MVLQYITNIVDDSIASLDFVVITDFDSQYLISITVQEDDGSYRYRALMQKTQLVLKFSLPHYIDLPIGTWCDYMGQRFYLGIPANFKKQGTRKFEYTLNMGTLENGMADYKIHNSVDGRLKWSMCAKPHEFIEEIVRNLNERDGEGVWSVGSCVESAEKTIEFNHSYIEEALQSVANTFETEWEIAPGEVEGTFVINLCKVEYYKDRPLALSYGRGNGFVPGVGRTSKSDEKPIKRLYVEGTDRNIDRSVYGEAELRLPRLQALSYDGSHFGGDKIDGNPVSLEVKTTRTYISDEKGLYIERIGGASDAVKEDSLDCSEIYPSRVGVVSDWVPVNVDKNLYNLVDADIPDDLNFEDFRIAGEDMTIIFQSGMLAGKEFTVNYYHAPKMVNGVQKQGKRFEIIPQEYDGVMMPNETFKPKTGADGDTYAVFGIQLPDAYICNDETKEGASWDMFREAVKFLYEHEAQKFTFTGELQGLWAKNNWADIELRLRVGGYVLFTDNQFARDGVLIRITGIKDYLTSPYSPVIEISNSVGASSSVSKALSKIDSIEVVIEDTEKRTKNYTQRKFRDAVETGLGLQAALDSLQNDFSGAINPITLQTMSVLVGDEALQFRFVRHSFDSLSQDVYTPIDCPAEYDNETRLMTVSASCIQHLTLGISTLECNRDPSHGIGYMQWKLPRFSQTVETDAGRLYLYAKVPSFLYGNRIGDLILGGEYVLDANPHALLEGVDYWLLIGILSSECEGNRSFVSVYGFTEILPGRITADKIVSADGESYFDLANCVMRLGDSLIYNLGGDMTLRLKFLTSENSNLGGWIFRDDLLISQKGTVDGNEAEYSDVETGGRFPGRTFIPNITMDAINGRIRQSENIIIDDDGISLLNDSGAVAAYITNHSIGDISDIIGGTKNASINKSFSQYLPFAGTYRQTIQIGSVDIGFLSSGSSMTLNNSSVGFVVPSSEGNNVDCTFAQMKMELYRGNSLVATLASSVTTSRFSGGQPVTLADSTAKTVTIGSEEIPEGNYAIRVSMTYDLVGERLSSLTDIVTSATLNYSYSKDGFRKTALGNDGFYTSWARNQYIFANRDGITLRHGNAIIRLSADGLKKSVDGINYEDL